MKSIWIIGAGSFGLRAAKMLEKRCRQVVLIDLNKENCKNDFSTEWLFVEQDGADFLYKNLSENQSPSWIVPAVPIHLAVEWCLLKIGSENIRRISLPDDISQKLPNPVLGKNGDMYVSHANFRCPETCNEPDDYCSITRTSRKSSMFDMLSDFWFPPFRSLVIRSYQLAPGVGGYRPEQLFCLTEAVATTGGQLMIATACRCHGVVTGLIHNKSVTE